MSGGGKGDPAAWPAVYEPGRGRGSCGSGECVNCVCVSVCVWHVCVRTCVICSAYRSNACEVPHAKVIARPRIHHCTL